MRKFTRLWLLLMAVTLSAGIMVAQAQKVVVQGAKKAQTEKGIKPSNVYTASEKMNQKALQEKKMSAEQPSVINFSNAGPVAETQGKYMEAYSPMYLAEKPVSSGVYDPTKFPPVDQGGDNIATATVISSITPTPYTDLGTTSGYLNDYDEVCPYTGSTSPDVVYAYTAEFTGLMDVTLCSDLTAYDTKLYVYDIPNPVTGDAIACNDDFCTTALSPYVSEILGVPITMGTTYYIVVDGYGTASGAYEITVSEGVLYPAPPNDDCSTATPVTGPYPQTVNGTTLGATVDCPGVLDWNAVWYSVTLPYATNNLTVDWCGTEDMATVGVVYYATCPVVCGSYILYTSNVWAVCGTPPGATTAKTTFLGIAGPTTIWYPAYSVPAMDHVLTFDVQDAGACEIVCPVGATPENEADIPDEGLDVTDGGCNSVPPVFKPLNIAGQSYCGMANTYLYTGLNYRDTDWYRLDLSEETGNFDLTWRAEAEFPVSIYILDALTEDCVTYTTLGSNSGLPCNVIQATALGVDPGVYYCLVLPTNFTGVPASGPHDYWATLIVTPAVVPTGCENLSQYPSGTIAVDANGVLTQISTCNFAGEYSALTNIQAGNTYQFTMQDLGTGAYVTVTDGPGTSGNILAFGPSPLTYGPATGVDLYVHWSLNASCATDGECHITSAQCMDCVVIPPPANDLCNNAEAIVGPYPVLGTPGTTIGATTECPGWLDIASGSVWYAIDLPYAVNNLTTIQHGDANFNNGYIVGTDVMCSCLPEDYYFSTYSFVVPDLTQNFAGIPGPATFYLPVATGVQGPFTLDVFVEPYYSVTGNVGYAVSGTPIDNSLVQISDDSKAYLGDVPTDANGDYGFYALAGNYNLGGFTYKPRGGTNLADANLVVSHLLGTLLTGLPFLSADVNNDGLVLLADYNIIVSKLLTPATTWAAPDWIFENPAFALSSDIVVDFEGICSGDPDGGYAVPFGSFAPYCDATTTTQDEWIDAVICGTINNVSAAWQGGVADYTAISTSIAPGGSLITVNNNPAAYYSGDQVIAWVDWNGDKVFTTGVGTEEYILATADAGLTYTGTITVPPGTPNGNYRMRVSMLWYAPPLPCVASSYGEVEDYTIVVP